jgi:ubiquinone/menaquinone biosynthesis C-methylase UbiE
MDAKLQRRIQRYGWDKAVDSYEHDWQQQLAPAQTRLLEMSLLRRGADVLDVACGTGLVTCQTAVRVGSSGIVVGIDISEHMLERARAQAALQHLHHITFDRMEAENLWLPSNVFNVALCALGLMYVPDPTQAVQEMYRVLKTGGRAVAAVWGQRDRCGWAAVFPVVAARVHSEVCPLFFQLGTGDMLALTFQAAGFTDVACQRLSTSLLYASAEEACSAAFAGGPVALAYSRFDARTRQAADAAYLAAIAAYGTGDGYAIPGEFVVVRGDKR